MVLRVKRQNYQFLVNQIRFVVEKQKGKSKRILNLTDNAVYQCENITCDTGFGEQMALENLDMVKWPISHFKRNRQEVVGYMNLVIFL